MDSTKGVKYSHISTYQTARQGGKRQMQAAIIANVRLQSEHHKRLRSEGWLPVECSEYFLKNWSQCHAQCKEMFGDNYTWTGDIFWFKTEADIMIFKLTFGA